MECVGRLGVILFYVAYMLLIAEIKAAAGLTNIFFIASLAGKRVDAGPDIGCGGV